MRKLHSVGDTLARPGESVQDVRDRTIWGDNGPFYGRIQYLTQKLADPEFTSSWNKGKQSQEQLAAGAAERLKFITAAQAVLGLVFDRLRTGDVSKARGYINVFKEKLNLPFELNEDATEIYLPIPGYEGGLKWPVGPNLSD